MTRSPRLFISDAIYHVYCRTSRGEMVFTSPKEVAEFVEVVVDLKKLYISEMLSGCSTTCNQYNNCVAGFHLQM